MYADTLVINYILWYSKKGLHEILRNRFFQGFWGMNLLDTGRNAYLMRGQSAKNGYMRWWHSFRGCIPGTDRFRTFFVEYFLLNPGLTNNKIVLEGKEASFCMIKAGAFPEGEEEGVQMHAYYPINDLCIVKDPFYVQMGDCSTFSETHITGSVWISERKAMNTSLMTDSGYMEWDLEICKNIAFHTGPISGPVFSFLNALDSFWHGEGIKTYYRGTVTFNEETYHIVPDTCLGYADKHWGRHYNQSWLQIASNNLFSQKKNRFLNYSAFAVDGCYTRFFGLRLSPKLLMQLTYTGEDFEFSFARPLMLNRMKWRRKNTNKRTVWQIKSVNRKAMIKCSINCPKATTLSLDYKCPEEPGKIVSLLASGSATGTIELYRMEKDGPKLIDTLTFENGFCAYQKSATSKQ